MNTAETINHNLGVVHLSLPTLNPSREQTFRQYVLDAVHWITLADLREKAALEQIAQMETRGKVLKDQIAHLEQLLNGKPETIPTVPAGMQQRGVDGELMEG